MPWDKGIDHLIADDGNENDSEEEKEVVVVNESDDVVSDIMGNSGSAGADIIGAEAKDDDSLPTPSSILGVIPESLKEKNVKKSNKRNKKRAKRNYNSSNIQRSRKYTRSNQTLKTIR